MTVYYHRTPHGETILKRGFLDHEGSYGLDGDPGTVPAYNIHFAPESAVTAYVRPAPD